MNIDKLTIGEAKQLAALFHQKTGCNPGNPYPVGENVFIRTVTMYYVGRLEVVTEQELVLTDAAWVAYSGRWAEALKTGVLDEVEPFPDGKVLIGRGAVIDCSIWSHALLRDVK